MEDVCINYSAISLTSGRCGQVIADNEIRSTKKKKVSLHTAGGEELRFYGYSIRAVESFQRVVIKRTINARPWRQRERDRNKEGIDKERDG